MLTTLKNAFKIKEIRQKILFTLGMLVVIRIGSQLPVPGVDTKFFSQWFAQQTGGAFSFFDAITGGSFLNMSLTVRGSGPAELEWVDQAGLAERSVPSAFARYYEEANDILKEN
mgnify:CR=1 FL=1